MTEGNRPVTLDDLKYIFESDTSDVVSNHLESEEIKKFRQDLLKRLEKLFHGQRIIDDLERMS